MLFVLVFNIAVLALQLLALPLVVSREQRKPGGYPLVTAAVNVVEIVGFTICVGVLWGRLFP